MITYKLSILADRPKGSSDVVMPGIEERRSTALEYYKVLNDMLRQIAREVQKEIIPLYQRELEQQRRIARITRDAPDRSWFQRLRDLARRLAGVSDATVERILELEAHRHTKTFMDTARRAVGVNLEAVVRNEQLQDYLRLAAARNASLITSLSDDVVKRVEQTVLTNFAAGNSVKTLKRSLTEQFGITQSRAELIAFDQTAKLNSDLNTIRQEQAGITEYDWTTSHDERVRPLHRRLDGKRYKYGQPTGAEQGLPPGQPIRCRCIARGVITF